MWLTRGRILEGVAWFDAIPGEGEDAAVGPAVRARALADQAVLDMYLGEQLWSAHGARSRSLENSRTLPCLPGRSPHAVTSPAPVTTSGRAAAYYSEAIELARALDDKWGLSQILAWQANTGMGIGDPMSAGAAGVEGRDLANAIGDRGNSRLCRVGLGWAHLLQGNIVAAIAQFEEVKIECEQAHDEVHRPMTLMGLGIALAYHGEVDAALATAREAFDGSAGLGDSSSGWLRLSYPKQALRRVTSRQRLRRVKRPGWACGWPSPRWPTPKSLQLC